MLIGVKIDGDCSRWSTYRGYWTDYVVKLEELIRNKDSGGQGRSRHQDYTPLITDQLYRWNDDC